MRACRVPRHGLKDNALALVFLVDVSGSMNEPNKLPLLKYALSELVKTLGAKDRVSLVVYAGASGVVLPPTSGSEHGKLLNAIEHLEAGGSTNGAAGIEAAYALAERAFDAKGVNRVVRSPANCPAWSSKTA